MYVSAKSLGAVSIKFIHISSISCNIKTSCLTWIKNIFFDHSLPKKTQHVNLGFSVFPERQLDIFIIQRCCKTRRESWFSSTYSLASWKERWHTLQYFNIDSLIDKILRFYNKKENQIPIKLRYSIRNSGEHIQFLMDS